ncbi:MAG: ABC-type Na+ efflux pump, permease component [Paenibacillaceae bacterium]|jgi:ABC-2 type transport system permease protein|nr:ABC-type Na+ efflux pump, permease component [Paenibacillaceae bacterium]
MNNGFMTVMSFTIKNKLRSKSFIVTSLLLVLLVTVGANLPYIISLFQSEQSADAVGAISGEIPGRLEQYYAAQENPAIVIKQYPDQGSQAANDQFLKDKVADGDIKGYLEFGETDAASGFPKVLYKSTSTLDFGITGKLQTGLQSVKSEALAKELSPEILARITAPVVIGNVQISTTQGGVGSVGSEGKTEEEFGMATVMVYVLIIVLFLGVMITGQLIATEITAEKSSRVMEVLITSVSPMNQMFGKIIGMLLVGLSQIVLIVAAAVGNLLLPHNIGALKDLDINLGSIDPVLLVYGIVFYLLGYFLYATVYAAVGSIVSRTEDLGQAVMPITLISLAGFYLAIFGIMTPDARYITVTSFIPFFTPFLMFMRIGLTDPSIWEVVLSLLILCASIFGMGWLSAKIYRTGVLMYGKRPSLKELRKAMKAYKV